MKTSSFMRIMGRLGFLIIAFSITNTLVFAQEEDFIRDEGEVVEGEFLISKELEITLPTAQRIFQKVPPDEIDAKETEPLHYTFKEYTPKLNELLTRLRVLKLKDERHPSMPASYLKLGFGNYITPYAELALNSGVSKKGNIGLKLAHLSSRNGPVDKENSGDTHNLINAYGRYTAKKASIGGDLEYYRDGYHFYGYDPGIALDKDAIRQVFDDINVGFDIKSNDVETALHYTLYAKVYNTTDFYNAAELGLRTGLQGKYTINEEMMTRLDLDFLYNSYKNPLETNRSLMRVSPSFVYKYNSFTLDAGMRIVNNIDTLDTTSETQIFPVLSVAYDMNDDISAYATLDGNVEELTYQKIVKENPFVNNNLPIIHTNKNIDIRLGLKGNLLQYLAFDLGLRSARYTNMSFYANDSLASNRFTLLYDHGKTSLFQGMASLSYVKNNTFGTTLSARYNIYETEELEKAWHRPTFELDYAFWYNIHDKIQLSSELYVLTGIETPNFEPLSSTTVKLDPAIDLNLKIDYFLSEKYGVFVSVNNLLNSDYQLYYRYPTRGILAIVGLSVSF